MRDTAKTYGASLYSLAREEKNEEEILSELRDISELFRNNPGYVKILDSPQVPQNELMTVLNEDFFEKVHKYTLNFLKLLCEKNMAYCLDECFREYEKLYNADNNVHIVSVTTAKPLRKEILDRLTVRLEEKAGGKIVLRHNIDETCIGGIIIEMDNRRIDASIKSGLENMKSVFIQE